MNKSSFELSPEKRVHRSSPLYLFVALLCFALLCPVLLYSTALLSLRGTLFAATPGLHQRIKIRIKSKSTVVLRDQPLVDELALLLLFSFDPVTWV